TACVWMGYNTPTPMPGAAGGGTPTTIWRDFFRDALDFVPDRNWFSAKGTPVWVPWTSKWQTSLGLDVAVGADPAVKRAADAAAAAEAEDEAAAEEPNDGTVPDTTAPPVDTGGGGAAPPAPANPAPANPAPANPAPAAPAAPAA